MHQLQGGIISIDVMKSIKTFRSSQDDRCVEVIATQPGVVPVDEPEWDRNNEAEGKSPRDPLVATTSGKELLRKTPGYNLPVKSLQLLARPDISALD